MGELITIPRRRPGSRYLGILGTSKGTSFVTGGSPSLGPSPTAVSPGGGGGDSIFHINTGFDQPQRVSAGGYVLPSSKPRIITPPAPPPPAPPPPPMFMVGGPSHYSPFTNPWRVPWGIIPLTTTVNPDSSGQPPPGAPTTGGGGGGGGAADTSSADGTTGDVADPPVFLGLTQKQLLIGGGLAVAAWFLLRKKKPGHAAAPAGEGF